MPALITPIYKLFCLLTFVPADKGIRTTVVAAVDPGARENATAWRGAYIVPPGVIGKATPHSRDQELAKELKHFTDTKMQEWHLNFD